MQSSAEAKKAFKHCCNGSEESFMTLVPGSVNINFQIPTSEFNRLFLENPSFLHCAAAHGKEKMAALLINLGINLDLRDGKGRTAAALACYYDNPRTLEVILQGGADPFINDYNGYAPIHWAVWKNSIDCIKLLLNYGADPCAHNFALREPIHIAARQGFVPLLEFLISKGANINAQTIDGRTPLYEATCATDDASKSQGRVETVEFLLNHGADASMPDLIGRTPLHWSSFYGHLKVTQLLLEHNADVTMADDEGVCPIHLACLSCVLDLVASLTNAGADLNCSDKHMRVPLHYAGKAGSLAVVKYLLARHVKTGIADDNGDLPIMVVDPQNTEIIEEIQRHSDQSKQFMAKIQPKAANNSSFRN